MQSSHSIINFNGSVHSSRREALALIWSLPSVIKSFIFGNHCTSHDIFTLMITSKSFRGSIHHYISTARAFMISSLDHLSILLKHGACHLRSLQFHVRVRTPMIPDLTELGRVIDMNRSSLVSLLLSSPSPSPHRSPSRAFSYNRRCDRHPYSRLLIPTPIVETISTCQRLRQLSLPSLGLGEELFVKLPVTLQHLEIPAGVFNLTPSSSLTFLSFDLQTFAIPDRQLIESLKTLVKSLICCRQLTIHFWSIALTTTNDIDDESIWTWVLPPSLRSVTLTNLRDTVAPILISSSLQHLSFLQYEDERSFSAHHIEGVTPSLISLDITHPFDATSIIFHQLCSLRFVAVPTTDNVGIDTEMLVDILDASFSTTLTELDVSLEQEYRVPCTIAAVAILHTFTKLESLILTGPVRTRTPSHLRKPDQPTPLDRFLHPPSPNMVHTAVSLKHLQCGMSSIAWLDSSWYFPSLTSFSWNTFHDEVFIEELTSLHRFLTHHSHLLTDLTFEAWPLQGDDDYAAVRKVYSTLKKEYSSITIPKLLRLAIIDQKWLPFSALLLNIAPAQLHHFYWAAGPDTNLNIFTHLVDQHQVPFGLTLSHSSLSSSKVPSKRLLSSNEDNGGGTIVTIKIQEYDYDDWCTLMSCGTAIHQCIVGQISRDRFDGIKDALVAMIPMERQVVDHRFILDPFMQ
jgi:hypothetical protein